MKFNSKRRYGAKFLFVSQSSLGMIVKVINIIVDINIMIDVIVINISIIIGIIIIGPYLKMVLFHQ